MSYFGIDSLGVSEQFVHIVPLRIVLVGTFLYVLLVAFHVGIYAYVVLMLQSERTNY